MNILDMLPEMGSESYMRPIELQRIAIWPSFLISVMIHAVFFFLLVTVLPYSRPVLNRCMTVALVTLGEDVCGGSGKESAAGAGTNIAARENPGVGESVCPPSNTEAVPVMEKAKPPEVVARKEEQREEPVPLKKVKRPPRQTLSTVRSDKTEVPKAPRDLLCRKPDTPGLASAAGEASEGGRAGEAARPNGVGPEGNPGGGNTLGTGSSVGGGGGSHQGGVVDARLGAANGPSFLRKVMPKYPPMARELGREGTVVLQVTIDVRGLPVRVELMKKAGYGLDDEAVRAIQNSTFVPAKIEGKLVVCKVLVPVRFQLEESEDE